MNFSVYWQHADAVSKTLYFVLLAMSITTWTIFALRLMGTRQLKQQAYAQLSQALSKLKAKFAPLNFEQRKAVAEQALLRQISAEKAQAEKGVAVLGTIASLAPFVGLFGTVWGIFHALVAVGKSGQAGLAASARRSVHTAQPGAPPAPGCWQSAHRRPIRARPKWSRACDIAHRYRPRSPTAHRRSQRLDKERH